MEAPPCLSGSFDVVMIKLSTSMYHLMFEWRLDVPLRRGAPWRGRLARDSQQVCVQGKGGPAADIHPIQI